MNRKVYITCNFNCFNEAKAHMKVTGRMYAEKMLSPVYTIQPLVKPVVRFDNRLYRVCKHSTGCQTRLTAGLTTGCIVYTAGCQTGCQAGCTTRFDNGLATGCIV